MSIGNHPQHSDDNHQATPSHQGKAVQPVPDEVRANADVAADMIRRKLDAIYDGNGPTARQEMAEVQDAQKPLSKHQKYMQTLSASGKPLPEIQIAWHNYYANLPNREKHEVWQEFYAASAVKAQQTTTVHAPAPQPQAARPPATNPIFAAQQPAPAKPASLPPPAADRRSVSDVKKQVLHKVRRSRKAQKQGKLTAKHHIQSIAFGLSMGVLAVVVVLFSFFNEIIIAPLIQPSRHVSATPLIVSADSIAPSSTPEVIIPKINVEIPVDYSQTSTDENVIENALENGVVHYPNTVLPGQNGNAAFFGHSSNNIFNPGKYKFAFVLLHELVDGDTFYLTYNGKVYAYQVISHQIVPPNDVGVLSNTDGKTATATLITCDPPGTSINRLVVTGEQISPDVAGNTTAAATTATPATPKVLASNGPSLWTRLWDDVF